MTITFRPGDESPHNEVVAHAEVTVGKWVPVSLRIVQTTQGLRVDYPKGHPGFYLPTDVRWVCGKVLEAYQEWVAKGPKGL